MFLSEDDLNDTIAGLRSADPRRLEQFWARFGPLLQNLADKNLSPGIKRRLGPEDVAQSACRSFLRRAREGEYHFDDADSLWRLLCAITLTKVREKTRFHMRQKRGVQFEAGHDGTGDATAGSADPAQVAEFNDFLAAVLASLDEEERIMLELRLQNCTQEEIAERLGCSERTVRRILKRVQGNFEKLAE